MEASDSARAITGISTKICGSGDTLHACVRHLALQRLGWSPVVSAVQNVQQYIELLELQTVSEEFLLEGERAMRQSGVVRRVVCATS